MSMMFTGLPISGTTKTWEQRCFNSTTPADIASGAASGTIVEGLVVYNDHTSSLTVNIVLNDGSNDRTLAQFTVAAKGSINVLASLMSASAKQFIALESGHRLRCQCTVVVSANVDIVAWGFNR